MNINDITDKAHSISTDSRTIKRGEIFIAIKGKKYDGHQFVKEAFGKGASAAIVSKNTEIDLPGKNVIKVRDTIRALGDIAMSHRLKFDVPVIAITGSNGKTTSKDLVSHALSSKYNVLKNKQSKNNLIGLPLTLLKLNSDHELAVLEMGMNHFKEIDRLSQIAKPKIGVITNIGPSHLTFLKNLRNVFIAKSELLKRLNKNDAAILNKDDKYLANIKSLRCKKIYFGIEKRCDFQAKNLKYKENLWSFTVGKWNFQSPLLGKHNVYNVLISIAIARLFEIDFSTIKKMINSFSQVRPMRLEFKNLRGVEILDDCYNSNPLSMECALDALTRYNTNGKRIVVSGDMLELGKRSRSLHEAIGRIIASDKIDVLIALGKLSKYMCKEASRKGMSDLYHVKSHRDAAQFLRKIAKPGDVVLIKGSRGMEMEKVIEKFKMIDKE